MQYFLPLIGQLFAHQSGLLWEYEKKVSTLKESLLKQLVIKLVVSLKTELLEKNWTFDDLSLSNLQKIEKTIEKIHLLIKSLDKPPSFNLNTLDKKIFNNPSTALQCFFPKTCRLNFSTANSKTFRESFRDDLSLLEQDAREWRSKDKIYLPFELDRIVLLYISDLYQMESTPPIFDDNFNTKFLNYTKSLSGIVQYRESIKKQQKNQEVSPPSNSPSEPENLPSTPVIDFFDSDFPSNNICPNVLYLDEQNENHNVGQKRKEIPDIPSRIQIKRPVDIVKEREIYFKLNLLEPALLKINSLIENGILKGAQKVSFPCSDLYFIEKKYVLQLLLDVGYTARIDESNNFIDIQLFHLFLAFK